MKPALTYPFDPRSTARISPGHFWPLVLKNGFFGCGRVLQVIPNARVWLFVGLQDWLGKRMPVCEDLAGSKIIDSGRIHLKCIAHTGGAITGLRPLDGDNIQLPLQRSAYSGGDLMRGGVVIGGPRPAGFNVLPVHATWGYNTIREIAEHRLMGQPSHRQTSVH